MAREVSIDNSSALFKRFYGKGDSVLVNAKTPAWSILDKQKRTDFVGDSFRDHIRVDSAVGLGYRNSREVLPTPGAAARVQINFSAAKAYGVAEYDREAILASRNSEGAFFKATVSEAEAVLEGFGLHNCERALFGDGSGKLGEIAAGTIAGAGTSASPWTFDLTTTGTNAPKGKRQYFPQGARMDLYTVGGVYGMTIQIVSAVANASTGVVTITATTVATGAVVTPVALDIIYWEGNKDKEITGLASIASTVAGNLYGISQTTNPKMRGLIKSISGALQYDDINEGVEALAEESVVPNLGLCSYKAMALLKNLSEDSKRYPSAEAKSYDAKISFKGVEVMGSEGPFPIVASQMCPDDQIFLLNTKHMSIQMRQDFGWFENGNGEILVPDQNKDLYFARYGGYFQLYCNRPNSVMKLYGFSL